LSVDAATGMAVVCGPVTDAGDAVDDVAPAGAVVLATAGAAVVVVVTEAEGAIVFAADGAPLLLGAVVISDVGVVVVTTEDDGESVALTDGGDVGGRGPGDGGRTGGVDGELVTTMAAVGAATGESVEPAAEPIGAAVDFVTGGVVVGDFDDVGRSDVGSVAGKDGGEVGTTMTGADGGTVEGGADGAPAEGSGRTVMVTTMPLSQCPGWSHINVTVPPYKASTPERNTCGSNTNTVPLLRSVPVTPHTGEATTLCVCRAKRNTTLSTALMTSPAL